MLTPRPVALLIAPLALLLGPPGCDDCSDYDPFYSACPRKAAETDSGSETETSTTQTSVSPAMCNDNVCSEEEDYRCSNDCFCGNSSMDHISKQEGTTEVCDDGPGKNSDDYQGNDKVCNAACDGYAPYCGDGDCQSQESPTDCPRDCPMLCGNGICDAGESMNCTKDCPVDPVCGNGVEEGNEECDGGPTDTATCDEDCTSAKCNDGHLNMVAGEECEDGNIIDSDACRNDCKAARCGDGVVFAAEEECDDGNDVDDDECSMSCEKPRFVFVTTGTYTGQAVAGVAGGDAKCQSAAQFAGLGSPANTWIAWLSDSRSSPATRAAENLTFGGWYFMRDSQGQRIPVAKGWAGLTNGVLDNPIKITEAGVPAEMTTRVWTNTAIDGTSAGSDHCTNWTLNEDPITEDPFAGSFGRNTVTNSEWTQSGTQDCTSAYHLYCVEVSQP